MDLRENDCLRCDVCGTQTENLPYPSRNYRGLCECRNLDWKVEEEATEQVLEKDDDALKKAIRSSGLQLNIVV